MSPVIILGLLGALFLAGRAGAGASAGAGAGAGAAAKPALLQFGSRGIDVKQLQQRLTTLGYSLVADGIYGEMTEAAVMQFQREHDLLEDGIVGPKTTAALRVASPRPKTASFVLHEIEVGPAVMTG